MALAAPIVPPQIVDLEELVEQVAEEHNVNANLMKRVIQCESQWNPRAIGDSGTSYGLAQIHLPAHPDVTKEQALNPEFAIRWMGEQWGEGNARAWTCFRNL